MLFRSTTTALSAGFSAVAGVGLYNTSKRRNSLSSTGTSPPTSPAASDPVSASSTSELSHTHTLQSIASGGSLGDLMATSAPVSRRGSWVAGMTVGGRFDQPSSDSLLSDARLLHDTKASAPVTAKEAATAPKRIHPTVLTASL